ncbi:MULTISPECIES: tetratricopeptide repeat protein [Acetobacter]|uniref:tetratricopeptide repeat protein n=1 Tax=Acetobacter TaxID=434 RepID=UPI0013026AC4|nr:MULTISPECIES: tetratricopeptide repeat protein [Acetobacter]MBS1004351.1 tetratricopeptide repeat protein [Acetobacter thailandicus]
MPLSSLPLTALSRVVIAIFAATLLAGCVTNNSHNLSDAARQQKAAHNPDAMMRIGTSAETRGDWAAAAVFYGHAMQLRPDNADYVIAYANALMHNGHAEEAINAIHKAENYSSDHNKIQLTLFLARLLNTARRSQEAIAALHPLIEQHPDSAPLRVALGVAYELSGDSPGAQQAYLTALKIDPHNIAARNNLALSEALDGQNETARKALLALRTEAVETGAPASSLATIDGNLAIVYALEGNLTDARQAAQGAALNSEETRQNMRFYSFLHASQGTESASSSVLSD